MKREISSSYRWFRGTTIVAFFCAVVIHSPALSVEPSVEDLKGRISSANVGDRPRLCVQIAERQLDAADKLYAGDETEKAQVALADVVAYSEMARDYAIQSNKRQKQTEIAARGMTRKLTDILHTLSHAERPPVEEAIRHLQRVRDDLLTAMFPKGGK